MNWKDIMKIIEEKNDWKGATQLLDLNDIDDPEIYLRVLFLLLALVTEGEYTQQEHDYAAKKLKFFFDKAVKQFSKNAEFLFFAGFIACAGEWYFGMKGIEPAVAMLAQAVVIEPNNMLYKWGYYVSIDQRSEKNTQLKLKLSEWLLLKYPDQLNWLKNKGLLGKYVLRIFEDVYKNLKAIQKGSFAKMV